MTETNLTPMARKVMTDFPVRKSRAQKERFRAWLQENLEELGYRPKVEHHKGIVKSDNVVAGDPDSAEVLLTAHYDTCAVLPVPNFITPRNMLVLLLCQLLVLALIIIPAILAEGVLLLIWQDAPMWLCFLLVYGLLLFGVWWMLAGKANRSNVNDNTSGVMTLLEIAGALPVEQRDKVCFVFFDNEEKGLLGSAAFAKAHKRAREETLVLNFDCVSDGDFLHLFPNKAVKQDIPAMERLERSFQGQRGAKKVEVVGGMGCYPSDQNRFAHGVGICALRKNPVIGYYMNKIHTGRDRVMEEENLLIFRDGVLNWLNQSKGGPR